MKKFLLPASLILNLLFVVFFVGKRIYYSSGAAQKPLPVPVNDSITTLVYNKYRFFDIKRSIYAPLPIAKTDVLFIGDSMTEQFPINEMFSTMNIKNRGISGSASGDVLKSVRGFDIPNTVFLMVGVNDFFYSVKQDITFKNIEQIIDLLHAKNPSVKVYIQSVLPVSDKKMTEKVVIFNDRVKALTKQHNATYVNLFPYFLKNGQINKLFTVDGVHLSAEGFKVWRDNIRKYIPQQAL
jgi:lysophospholipase L1-like esterase